MSEAHFEAIGGWLKDEDDHLDRTYRRLSDICSQAMNANRVAYFEDYRRRYFNDHLVPGQGVEEILEALTRHGEAPHRWIDLGAGVTTLFWSIGVNTPGMVAACDLVPEALHVLSVFKAGSELPQCYKDALLLTGRTESEFNATRALAWDFHVMDCLKPWSLPLAEAPFDLITAIGCFGLAKDPEHYEQAFVAAAEKLAPNGRLIGADWIRSASFIEQDGHDNRYLGTELSMKCAQSAGLSFLTAKSVTIVGDPYYDALIVWAFSK